MTQFPIARRATAGTATALLLLTVLAACGNSDTASSGPTSTGSAPPAPVGTAPSAGAASGTVSATDQSGDGTSLTITSVDLKGVSGGWIAVHMDLGGKPGPVVGVVAVPEGASSNVKVMLDKKVATGAYWPMLHVDDHIIGRYEFPKTPGADLPVMSGSGIVMKKITLTVT
jgi:hypothetical protein